MAGTRAARSKRTPLPDNGTTTSEVRESPHAEFTVLQEDGMLLLPFRIQKAARLKEGAVIEAEITDEGVLLRWRRPSDDERTWQRARKRLSKLQAEAARERAALSTGVIYTDEEFLAALEAAAADDADV
ncbi:MAG: hypothetical protein ACRDJE_12890 [Dehalococcoidia bacterium]